MSELLLLARTEATQIIELGAVSLPVLLDKVVTEGRKRADGQLVDLSITSDATVLGDAARLEQIFSNLLDNALRYTAATGTIVFAVRQDGKGGPRSTFKTTGSALRRTTCRGSSSVSTGLTSELAMVRASGLPSLNTLSNSTVAASRLRTIQEGGPDSPYVCPCLTSCPRPTSNSSLLGDRTTRKAHHFLIFGSCRKNVSPIGYAMLAGL